MEGEGESVITLFRRGSEKEWGGVDIFEEFS